jgi:hypothetical protein
MLRPALRIQTVFFDDSDRNEARRLGADLYEHLTRPTEDLLAYGAGIPVLSAVSADVVELEAADVVILVPVLGKTSFFIQRARVLTQLADWHDTLGPGHVLVVPTDSVWRNVEDTLPGKQLLTELYGERDQRRRTLDEIVLAVTRLLEPDPATVQLFVSHAKADVNATDDAAKKIHDYVVTDSTGKAFFDTTDLHPGESLDEQLDDAVRRGVFIAVRGDAYSSRVWCQRELLTAKLHKLPTLTVEVLRKGELRSSPYGGNSPSMLWDGNPAKVVSRAMIEWLRAAYFAREAARIVQVAGLPSDVHVLARPPELLDLAQGPLQSVYAQLVMHPDPELSVIERQVLKAARPRLQVVTPTTVFRRLLSRGDALSPVTAPLEHWQVAMSLSTTPDVNGPEGYTEHHVIDATVSLARTLIAAGAAIAYGGDFRQTGFTPLLAELIKTYNQTAAKSAQFLHSYLAATILLEDASGDLPLTVHHLVHSAEVARDAIMPPPSAVDSHPAALYFSDMRQVMAKHTAARVILGGNTEPRTEQGGRGYVGRYPGIVEEAWRTLKVRKPLYVLGGFGGASALVADLLEGKDIPPQLLERTWDDSEYFRAYAKTIDADPYGQQLGLPQRVEDLAQAVCDCGLPLLANNEASVRWNGLTVEENRFLFRTRDPVMLALLVLKGLLAVARQHSQDKLEIELVHGSLTTASHLDAVAVATFDNIPLGGAGATLDRAMGGRASAERAKGRSLISLETAEIDADWLCLASLGPLENVEGLEQRIEQASHETATQSRRHGFRRLGVVAFGGTVLTDVESITQAMLRGFAELQGHTTVVWFESNNERFDRLREQLASREEVKLTTRRMAIGIGTPPVRDDALILQVSLENEDLTVTALPPAGSAIASSRRVPLSYAQLASLAEGVGDQKRRTPSLETLNHRGAELAEILLGTDAAQLLALCREAKVVVVHDVPSSRLPFEMLTTVAPAARPAVHAGISRRLAVKGVPVERLFSKPPKAGTLHVLLIVDPTEDLEGTVAEANAVRTILEQHKNRVELKVLTGNEAMKQAVLQALSSADILHYCGHAFFDGPGADQSGLILAGQDLLTLEDLEGMDTLPSVAFVNACESGRVRGPVTTEAAAFAELFLRSGVEAYVGTYWRVGDSAAANFATGVYTRLAEGQTLEAAVTQAREALLNAHVPDWANYILYGDGHFRLVVS